MVSKGKTGVIHGVVIKPRTASQPPKYKIDTSSADGRQRVTDAAKHVFERHHAVIKALAKR